MHDGAMTSQKRPRTGTRITVTIQPDHYELVSLMAKAKKVSNAWIIRDAVEKYLAAEQPFTGKDTR